MRLRRAVRYVVLEACSRYISPPLPGNGPRYDAISVWPHRRAPGKASGMDESRVEGFISIRVSAEIGCVKHL